MAFWGIEVKSGKPVTHEKGKGRLRVSQATLGLGEAAMKTVVQCNVGSRAPLLLCALLPNRTESCSLDLEYEEEYDVIFSVIGPRSVHLTGYYVHQKLQSNACSDTESFGVDIENSQSDGSNCHSDDDKYEDSFIDDGELQFSPPSPVSSSREMCEMKEDKPKGRKGKRLKKKGQAISSDDDEAHSRKSEDDGGYLFSAFCKGTKAVKKTMLDDEENDDPIAVEKGEKGKDETKETVDPLDTSNKTKSGKTKRKRKEQSEKEGTSKLEVDKDGAGEEKGHELAASKNMELAASSLVLCPKKGSEDGQKSKKRRKKCELEETCEEETRSKFPKDDKSNQEVLLADTVIKDLATANGECCEKIDINISMKSELHAESHREKKSRKKMLNKTQDDGNLSLGNPSVTNKQETKFANCEDRITDVTPIDKRTLSNGLTIEVLADGQPDGKVAAPGKKVKIHYTGMLKESGKIFDTNVGKTACKFRLGDQEVLGGWNIGIDGMRVGEKRRLTVPPSLGFGNHGGGENVPPNSWLVYDVELVGVRRSPLQHV